MSFLPIPIILKEKMEKISYLILSVILLSGCLTQMIWENQTSEETIIGTLKLDDKALIVVGRKNCYAITENHKEIVKLLKEFPDLAIDLDQTKIIVDPKGFFEGHVTLVTRKNNKKNFSRLNILGNIVKVQNVDEVREYFSKEVNLTIHHSPTNIKKAMKIISTPIVFSADAGMAAAGTALAFPIIILASALGADF